MGDRAACGRSSLGSYRRAARIGRRPTIGGGRRAAPNGRQVQSPPLKVTTAGTSGRSVLPRTIIRAVQRGALYRYATRAIVVRGEVHSRAQI